MVTKPTKRYDLRTDYNEAGSWLGLELVQEENEIHYQHSSHHSLHLCQAPHFPQTLLGYEIEQMKVVFIWVNQDCWVVDFLIR